MNSDIKKEKIKKGINATHCESVVGPLNIGYDYQEKAKIHQKKRVLYSSLPENLITLVEILPVKNLCHLLSFFIQLVFAFSQWNAINKYRLSVCFKG